MTRAETERVFPSPVLSCFSSIGEGGQINGRCFFSSIKKCS